MVKLYLFISALLIAANISEKAETELLQLKSNWSGNGMAILYPGSMKLLSQRLTQQAGMMTTITQMPAGDTWELEISFKITCKSEPRDLGVGFWLTINDPKVSPMDYNFENVFGTYGMVPSIDGLGLVYTNKTLFTGLMRSQGVSRADLVYRSKSCKIYLEEGKHVKFKVKYRNKVLGVYSLEHKEKNETLCVQYTDIENFNNYYISSSAAVESGKCTVELDHMRLDQPQNLFQVIDESDKRIGDAFFAYFSDLEKTKHHQNWEEYNSLFQHHRENSKILAQELMEFADMNQNELGQKFTEGMSAQLDKIKSAIDVIGIEAKQLESLSSFVEQEKRQTKGNVEDFSDQVLEWLSEMDGAYTKVDDETKRIYEVLNEMNVNDKMSAMIKKSESVVEALNSLLFKAKSFTDESKLKDFDTDNLDHWDDQLKNVKKELKKKINTSTSNSSSALKKVAYGFLASIAGGIFLAFGFMYWKIQKAIKHKRIL